MNDDFPMDLDEFCTRLSIKERRVALIGAFHARMKRQGMTMATQDDWMTQYRKMTKRPVDL